MLEMAQLHHAQGKPSCKAAELIDLVDKMTARVRWIPSPLTTHPKKSFRKSRNNALDVLPDREALLLAAL